MRTSMRIRWFVLLLLVGLAFECVTLADQLKVTWANPHGTLQGGIFIFTPLGGALSTTPFYTFCMEMSEHLNIGSTYDYTLSNAIEQGGGGGLSPDPISLGTAWLYSQFRFNMFMGILNSADEQDALQTAFWVLEKEETIANPQNNKYLKAASNKFKPGEEFNLSYLQQDAGSNNFGVFAVNLTTTNKDGSITYNQSALGVPEPGALFLIGLGLLASAGLGWRRSRKG